MEYMSMTALIGTFCIALCTFATEAGKEYICNHVPPEMAATHSFCAK